MPDGYVFVTKGDAYITRTCRIKTKETHQVVYTVYVSNNHLLSWFTILTVVTEQNRQAH